MESSEQSSKKPSPTTEFHRHMEGLIVTKYGRDASRTISQAEAREDALEYLASELAWLVVAPSHTPSGEIDTINRQAEDKLAIIEALDAKDNGDWSAIKFFLQDRQHLNSAASKTEAFPEHEIPGMPDENPILGEAFVRIANLIT